MKNPDSMHTGTFVPLRSLVKIKPRAKHVSIEPRLLDKLDLTKLRRTLKFTLGGTMCVAVKLKAAPLAGYLKAKVTIAFDPTAWPNPSQRLRRVFYSVVDLAAEQMVEGEEKPMAMHSYEDDGDQPVVLRYYFPASIRGSKLIDDLEKQIAQIQTEMSSVLNVIARGPQPGMTVPDPFNEGDEDVQEDG